MEELEKEVEKFYKQDLTNDILIDSLHSYILYISQFDILPAEDQRELIRRYHEEGDQQAFEKEVNHNLKLSVFIAKKFIGKCESMTIFDLIQEANLSLVQAIRGYDLTRDVTPCTYIAKAMSNNIIREINRTDCMIRKPTYIEELAKKLAELDRNFIDKYKRFPTREEVKEYLSINDDQYNILTSLDNTNTVSLNQTVAGNDDDSELQDFVADIGDKIKKKENDIDSQILIKTAKDILTPKEYYLIYNRIISDERETLASIGEKLGITRERARQIQGRALRKLRGIKKKEIITLRNYSIDELLSMELEPLSVEKIIVYRYLKKNIDPITYFFMFTKNEKEYNLNMYKEQFPSATEEKIIEYLNYCEELEKAFFNEEFLSKVHDKIYNELIKYKTISLLFDLNIQPTKEIGKFSKELRLVDSPKIKKLQNIQAQILQ